jgi:glutamyl-tRNA(Gln) amidotransferase subunit E
LQERLAADLYWRAKVKIGIEIHQRLYSGKLFCECDSALLESYPSLTMQRRLHPVLSELGEIDRASKAEFAKGRLFEYQVFQENNCLVEMDEEPPRNLNSNALKIALEIAIHLHAKPVEEVHVMRKIVIDGSNTGGFQRTALIALNGHIDTSKGPVKIPSIAIEEESAGIVSKDEIKAIYKLDRLGIPLIEITTDPDIKDKEHLKEVAEKIGMVLRATGKVARGLGTIRQDVNISTEGGARIEIKGAQNLAMLTDLVINEEKRQLELIKILHELRNRKALPVKSKPKDVTSIFKKTQAKLIAANLKKGAAVLALKLSSHKGILGMELQHNRRYGTELSDYAKMAGVKGIIHSDENLEKYGISKDEEKHLHKELSIGKDDAFVMVVAPKKQAEKALENVLIRANLDSVPEETRKANPDGTSSFMRPLPGKARLYPETDVPPIPLTKDVLDSVEVSESLEDKKKKLEKMLNKQMAANMLKSRHLHLFERLVEKDCDPLLVATTLENTIVSLRREGIEFKNLEKTLTNMFEQYNQGAFVKAAIADVLKGMAKGASAIAVIKVYRLQKITGKDLEKIIKDEGHDMKAIMAKHRLQVDPAEVAELIKKK